MFYRGYRIDTDAQGYNEEYYSYKIFEDWELLYKSRHIYQTEDAAIRAAKQKVDKKNFVESQAEKEMESSLSWENMKYLYSYSLDIGAWGYQLELTFDQELYVKKFLDFGDGHIGRDADKRFPLTYLKECSEEQLFNEMVGGQAGSAEQSEAASRDLLNFKKALNHLCFNRENPYLNGDPDSIRAFYQEMIGTIDSNMMDAFGNDVERREVIWEDDRSGQFRVIYRYFPKKYLIEFDNAVTRFEIHIIDAEDARCSVREVTGASCRLNKESIQESVCELSQLIAMDNFNFYYRIGRTLYRKSNEGIRALDSVAAYKEEHDLDKLRYEIEKLE